ncbi:phosphotriesterase [Arthrobacter sp. Soil763]|uniref:phosphotriesterase family protein n=1 Tax=Arthrobacter sp. Soil763 TaxID=1736402 RepID=UPI0006FAD749|nr:aryldialkylphosphatase [Arthrobacter sp. Soil763]KRE81785.1 aryldialkylphosphatase [Arthrobacter sp. Soil763]
MSFVRTVLGDIAPDRLGPTNYHEHLFQASPLLPGDELDNELLSGREAALLRGAGTTAMVEATPLGLGRNPAATARIAAAAGLHIVATTGAHREAHYPEGHWLRSEPEERLARRFTAELTAGCGVPEESPAAAGEAPVRAGLLKAGVGYWSITAFERRVLAAAAVAHSVTGAPVMVHLEFCTAAHEVLDLLSAGGVRESRVILAHADRNPDAGLHLELASRGAYLGYDGMARPKGRSDAELIDLTEQVLAGGGGHRLLLGGDVARRTRYISYGGMPGLAYLAERFLPRLEARVGADAVDRILRGNAAAVLQWTGSEQPR